MAARLSSAGGRDLTQRAFALLLFVCALLLFTLALLSAALRLGLPYAGNYKDEMQNWASDYLRTPVEIGHVDFSWPGAHPRVELRDVALLNSDATRAPFRLERILLDLNLFKSLFRQDWYIDQVTLAGADLSLEYLGRRKFKMRGINRAVRPAPQPAELPASAAAATTDEIAGNPAQPIAKAADAVVSGGVETTPRRDATGGLDVVAWLLNAKRVALVDSRITLLDRKRGIDYRIQALNIDAENDGDEHRLRLALQLPDQLGKSLEVGVDFVGQSQNLQASEGDFYVEGDALQLQQWSQLWPQLPVAPTGAAGLELWGSWSGTRATSIRTRVVSPSLQLEPLAGDALTDRNAQTGTGTVLPVAESASDVDSHATPAIELAALDLDISWARRAEGWQLLANQLSFEHQGQHNAIDVASLVWQPGSTPAWSANLGSEHLSLPLLHQTLMLAKPQLADAAAESRHDGGAGASPDATPSGQVLSELIAANWRGTLQNWTLRLQQGPDLLANLDLRGEIAALETDATARLPAISGLDADIDIRDGSGTVALHGAQFQLHHERVFPRTLSLDTLQAKFDVSLSQRGLLFDTERLTAADEHLLAEAGIKLQLLPQQPLRVDLRGNFSLDDVTRLNAYLPTGRMRQRLVRYLDSAPQRGRIKHGEILMMGHVNGFPYHRKPGIFRMDMDVEDLDMQFNTSWPVIRKANARMLIDANRFTASVATGRMNEFELDQAVVRIDNVFQPYLKLVAVSDGQLQDMIEFARTGPLRERLAAVFDGTSGTGSARLTLDLGIPLRPARFRDADEILSVRGVVSLADNDLQVPKYGVELEAVEGDVGFTDNGLVSSDIKAKFDGRTISIDGSSGGQGDQRYSELGLRLRADAQQVLRRYGIPLADRFSGVSDWYLNLEVPHSSGGKQGRSTKLSLSSTLVGTAWDLPAPLGKTAEQARRTVIKSEFGKGAPYWHISSDDIQASIRMQRSGPGIQAMLLTLGEKAATRLPEAGVRVQGTLETAALDEWTIAITDLIDELGAGTETAAAPMPVSAEVRINNMRLGWSDHGPATLRVNTAEGTSNVVLQHPLLAGNARFPRRGTDPTVRVRLAKLDKQVLNGLLEPPPASVAADYTEPSDDPLDPTRFPPLIVHARDITWDEWHFRDVRMQATPDSNGLRVEKLGFADTDAQLIGSGYWGWTDPQGANPLLAGQQQTSLQLQLRSRDFGTTFNRLGFSDSLADGNGTIDMDFRWDGALYAPVLSDLQGKVDIDLRRGRVLNIEPGAARVFGLFALQAIPRRLSLDFSDITAEGLDFTRLSGQLDLAGGLAVTELVQLDGPVGVIDISGAADFVSKRYNHKVSVLPRISSALPLIGVISGGATAGIGALVAGPVLKALGLDIDKIGYAEYAVTGSWDEPLVNSIPR